MGNHEFGIQLSGVARRFKTGNLHLHIEFTLPDEQKIVSYTLPIDAQAITENTSLTVEELTGKYQHLFQTIYTHVDWPVSTGRQTLSAEDLSSANVSGTEEIDLPLFLNEEDQAFIAEQIQASTSHRVSAQDKEALQDGLDKFQESSQDLTLALKNVIKKSLPAVLLLGPNSPSEAELLGSLKYSFPMIGYKGATLADNLSLLRPNQENMIFLYSHGNILNGQNFPNRAWMTKYPEKYQNSEIIRKSN